jgi:hypothetical protein
LITTKIIAQVTSSTRRALRNKTSMSRFYGTTTLDMKNFFEYAGSKTPHRNRKVERMFQTLYIRIRAMFNGSELQEEIRSGI